MGGRGRSGVTKNRRWGGCCTRGVQVNESHVGYGCYRQEGGKGNRREKEGRLCRKNSKAEKKFNSLPKRKKPEKGWPIGGVAEYLKNMQKRRETKID